MRQDYLDIEHKVQFNRGGNLMNLIGPRGQDAQVIM